MNNALMLRNKTVALAFAALLAATLPWWAGDQYQLHLAALICVYWILIAGLNLAVGYTGQLSIGHVGLLAIGAYAFAILVGKMGWHPALAVAAAGALGGLCGLALGLPSLRLPGFYFAMATMAFALIVNELVLAQVKLTGGGVGLPGPLFPAPFDSPQGFYYLVAALALAVAAAGALGGLCGLALGLPSLRLPGFYFAMATMAFALIVNELALAQVNLTGGGVGLPGPMFPPPFDSPQGFYYLVAALALTVTLLSWNIARRMWGRGLMSIRDNPVTAQAVGVPLFRAKLVVFVFSGVTAGVAGAMFASLQSYITPDTFVFELSLFFFVCIIIGGRGSIIGPFLGTVMLTALPELVAPLAKLGNLFYGLLLLVVVLVVPEGIGRMFELIGERFRPRRVLHEAITPDLPRLSRAIGGHR